MVPPRLSLVQRGQDDEPTATDVTAPANDAAPQPVSGPEGASPVHDLIADLEAAPSPERREKLRILEAVIFAASEPLGEDRLLLYLKPGDDLGALLMELQTSYAGRGVELLRLAGKWTFRTAADLSYVLERHAHDERRLSKAALETLSIIAYHQPVTRAEIEEIRGVTTSKGTLDVLMESSWIRPRGRRRAPGKPITYGTTDRFLQHFGLDSIKDLPGLAELKGAGLLDANLPPDFKVPEPTDIAALMLDELPLEAGDEAEDQQAELELDEREDTTEGEEQAEGEEEAGDAFHDEGEKP